MRAINGRIIVKANLNQKETITIQGPVGPIELWMGKKYLTNHREKNPVLCEVLHNDSRHPISEGDVLVVHHNYLSDPKTNQYLIEYDPETGVALFVIPANHGVFCILDGAGTPRPLYPYLLAQRVKEVIHSRYIHIPDSVSKDYGDRCVVISVAPEEKILRSGQMIVHRRYGDYEIVYNFGRKEHSLIRIDADDVEAVIEN